MPSTSLLPPPRPAAPRGDLRLKAGLILAALIQLLLGLLGGAEEPEVALPASTVALVRDAARAVATPAWSQRPRDMFDRTLVAQYVWMPLQCRTRNAAAPQARAGETAWPAARGSVNEGWPPAERQGHGGGAGPRAVRSRTRGPPQRAGPPRHFRGRAAA